MKFQTRLFDFRISPLHTRSSPHPLYSSLGSSSCLLLLRSGLYFATIWSKNRAKSSNNFQSGFPYRWEPEPSTSSCSLQYSSLSHGFQNTKAWLVQTWKSYFWVKLTHLQNKKQTELQSILIKVLGIVTSGFGLSSTVFSPLQTFLINPNNLSPMKVKTLNNQHFYSLYYSRD